MTAPHDSNLSIPPSISSTPPGTTSPVEYRYSGTEPGCENWMIGKTPGEIAAMARQAVSYSAQQLQAIQQQTRPPAPTLDPNDYLTGQQFMDHGQRFVTQAQQAAQQAAQPAIDGMAQMTLNMVKTQRPEVFGKYGHEVLALLDTVPKQNWTIDNVNLMADVVRGRHIEELANDRARQLLAQDPALRSSGTNGLQTTPPEPSPWDALPEGVRNHLQSQGITLAFIREHAPKMGMTEKAWIEKFGKTTIGAPNA